MDNIVTVYEKEYEILNKLPQDIKISIKELIFSYRNGEETICAVFNNKDPLLDLLGNLPETIMNTDVDIYGVDLESIGTDQVRVYHSHKEKDKMLIGYYMKNNEIVEYKIYKRTDDRSIILIDRYNSNNELISGNEKEVRAERSEWPGSKRILKLADLNGFYINFLKKADKDQFYARVRII
jgi:hypothetical protein